MQTISRMLVIFLLNSLWLTALIVGSAWSAARLLRNVPARYRHRVWVAALVLCWLLPLWNMFALSPALSSGASARLIFNAASVKPATDAGSILRWSGVVPFDRLWTNVIASAFVLLFLLRMALFLRICFRTMDLHRASSSFEIPETLLEIARRCQSVLKIRSQVALLSSPLARSPFTFGVIGHTIVLPESLLRSATEEDWISALSHEMAHIRRRDFLKNLVCQLLSAPLCFHPAMAFLLRQIERTRELACDELATERLISPAGYARALVNMAGLMSAPSKNTPYYSLGVFDANILEERIMKLLAPNHLSSFKTKMLLAAACIIPAAPIASATALALTVESPSQEQSSASAPANSDHKGPKIDPDVIKPKPVHTPDPEFPRSAQGKKPFNGSVTLAIVVDKEGKVESAKVMNSLGRDFDDNAIKAVKTWTFEPATKDGKPVPVELHVEVNFKSY